MFIRSLICSITLCFSAQAQPDSMVVIPETVADTVVYDSARHFQVEIAGMYTPIFMHFSIGADFVACKPGWYNHFAISFVSSGEFDDGAQLFGVGKKRVWEHKNLVFSAGLNTGFFHERSFHDVGIFLQPEAFTGYRFGGLTLGVGGYIGGCAAWSGMKKTGETGYNWNPAKWFYYSLIYSPYVKVVFNL